MSDHPTWRWLATLLLAAFLAIGGWAWTSTVAQVMVLQTNSVLLAKRVIRVEYESETFQRDLSRLQEQLTDMNMKLDQILLSQ